MKSIDRTTFLILVLLAALNGCQMIQSPSPTPTPTLAPPTQPPPTAEPTSSPTRPPATPTPTPTSPLSSAPDQTEALQPASRSDLAGLSPLTHYQIDLDIDFENQAFAGRQTVDYVNTESTPLDALNFRLFPNGAKAYGDGSLIVPDVTVGDEAVEPALALNDTVLEVPLPATLEPGDAAQIKMNFEGTVPIDFGSSARSGYGIYNVSDNVMALSGWFPILAVYDDEGWNLDPTSSVGDSVYADDAFYTVDVTTPDDLVLTATGIPLSQESLNGETHYQYVTGPVRDFFIALSPDFEHVTDSVEGVTVNSYYLPGHAAGGESALIVAMDALRVYNAHFGRYPYVELDVVDAPMQNAAGVEYPTIVLIGDFLYNSYTDPFFETATAHEVAHQWWYNLVGSDVIDEPWLDEALVTYSSSIYFEDVDGPGSARQIVAGWRQTYNQAVQQGADDLVTEPLSFWEEPAHQRYYGAIVYLKGALFFQAVRDEIGDEAFFEALQNYYAMNKYEIGTPEELLGAFEDAAGRQLDNLYEEWLLRRDLVGGLMTLDAAHDQGHRPDRGRRLFFLGQERHHRVVMADGDRLVAPDRVRLMHKRAVCQRLGERTRCIRHIHTQQPVGAGLRRGQHRGNQPHQLLLLDAPLRCRCLRAGGHEEVLDGIIHTAVRPLKQRAQAQLDH